MVPQVAQGALAIECRADDGSTRVAPAAVDDPAVRRLVEAERAFLAELGGGCTLPVGAHAAAAGDGAGALVDRIPVHLRLLAGDEPSLEEIEE